MLRGDAEAEMAEYINVWAIITEAAAFCFAITAWVLVLTALGRSEPWPNAGSFTVSALSPHKFPFQTGIQPAHHTGLVHQDELSTFNVPRSQRMRCVLSGAHSIMSLTSKQRHTEKGFLSFKGGDPKHLDHLNELQVVRKRGGGQYWT